MKSRTCRINLEVKFRSLNFSVQNPENQSFEYSNRGFFFIIFIFNPRSSFFLDWSIIMCIYATLSCLRVYTTQTSIPPELSCRLLATTQKSTQAWQNMKIAYFFLFRIICLYNSHISVLKKCVVVSSLNKQFWKPVFSHFQTVIFLVFTTLAVSRFFAHFSFFVHFFQFFCYIFSFNSLLLYFRFCLHRHGTRHTLCYRILSTVA